MNDQVLNLTTYRVSHCWHLMYRHACICSKSMFFSSHFTTQHPKKVLLARITHFWWKKVFVHHCRFSSFSLLKDVKAGFIRKKRIYCEVDIEIALSEMEIGPWRRCSESQLVHILVNIQFCYVTPRDPQIRNLLTCVSCFIFFRRGEKRSKEHREK